MNRPPLDDKRVRKALSMALDRESLVGYVLKGGQAAAYHFTPPNTAGYKAQARIVANADEARKLLAEAGYPGGVGFPKMQLLYNTSEKPSHHCPGHSRDVEQRVGGKD